MLLNNSKSNTYNENEEYKHFYQIITGKDQSNKRTNNAKAIKTIYKERKFIRHVLYKNIR